MKTTDSSSGLTFLLCLGPWKHLRVSWGSSGDPSGHIISENRHVRPRMGHLASFGPCWALDGLPEDLIGPPSGPPRGAQGSFEGAQWGPCARGVAARGTKKLPNQSFYLGKRRFSRIRTFDIRGVIWSPEGSPNGVSGPLVSPRRIHMLFKDAC